MIISYVYILGTCTHQPLCFILSLVHLIVFSFEYTFDYRTMPVCFIYSCLAALDLAVEGLLLSRGVIVPVCEKKRKKKRGVSVFNQIIINTQKIISLFKFHLPSNLRPINNCLLSIKLVLPAAPYPNLGLPGRLNPCCRCTILDLNFSSSFQRCLLALSL